MLQCDCCMPEDLPEIDEDDFLNDEILTSMAYQTWKKKKLADEDCEP